MNAKEKREKRARLLAEARAVLDTADREGRGLTSAEREDYDRLFAEAQDLKEDIGRVEGQAAAEAELRQTDGPVVGPMRADDADDRGLVVGPLEQWRTATGEPVPVLGPEHRFVDLPEVRATGFAPGELSIGRMIRAVARGDWRDAEAERRALGGGVAGTGGFLIPIPVFSEVIDKVRAQSVLVRAGMRTVPMTTQELTIARVETDVTPASKGENAQFSESPFGFGAVTLGARLVGAFVILSRELAADAPNGPQIIERVLSAALTAKIDSLGLAGAGGVDPVGLVNHPDVQKDEAVGAPDWDKVLDGIALVENENIDPSAWIAGVAVKTLLAKLKDGTGQYNSLPPQIQALLKLTTTAATAETLVLGGFSSFLMGLRQDAMLETSTETSEAFKAHQLWVKITARLDFALAWPRHIVVMSGITAG